MAACLSSSKSSFKSLICLSYDLLKSKMKLNVLVGLNNITYMFEQEKIPSFVFLADSISNSQAFATFGKVEGFKEDMSSSKIE